MNGMEVQHDEQKLPRSPGWDYSKNSKPFKLKLKPNSDVTPLRDKIWRRKAQIEKNFSTSQTRDSIMTSLQNFKAPGHLPYLALQARIASPECGHGSTSTRLFVMSEPAGSERSIGYNSARVGTPLSNSTIVVETQTRLRSEKLAHTNREEEGDSLVLSNNMTLGATGGVHHGRSQWIGAQRVQS